MSRQHAFPHHLARAGAAALIAALLIAADDPPSAPAPLRTFGDWTIGCDNQRSCMAVALVPDAEDRDRYLMLTLTRGGRATAPAQLAVMLPATVARGKTVSLAVDRKTIARIVAPGNGAGLALPFSGSLANALIAGHRVAIVDSSDQTLATASLEGLSAALTAMDDAQYRTGGVTALRRPGTRPGSRIPPVPPLPVVVQPPVTGKPPRALSAKRAAKLIGRDNAACGQDAGAVAPQAFRLDATHTLVTVEHPCGNGAYNIYTSLFVVPDKGKPAPAILDAPSGFSGQAGNIVINGGWEPATRRVTAFLRARGLGDCGSQQQFAWDGARLRLVDQRDMGECRQVTSFIPTWRAQVVVR